MLYKKLKEFFNKLLLLTTSYSINVFPFPLSEEEESKYICLMEKGDKNARSKLIEHNLRLVAHIVKKFESFNENPDDLISIGTIGLIKGIDTYNSSKKVKITTYAAKCIENEILMYIRSNKKNTNNISLNDSIGFDKEGNEITLLDILAEKNIAFNDKVFEKENIYLLKEYIESLNKREKEVIIYRYGLLNNEELTQKEIAKKMGISRSYVSRIEKRALVKILRKFLKNNNVE